MAKAKFHFRKVAQAGALFLILLGIAVLLGWLTEVSWLKTLLPGQISVKANSAFAFLCCGWTLWLLLAKELSRPARFLCIGLSSVVLATGGLTVLEYLLRADLKIDQLLFVDHESLSFPGRIAELSALNFCAAGAGLLLLSLRNRAKNTAQFPAMFIGFTALIAITGYVYDVPMRQGPTAYISIGLNTAFGFFVLSWTMLSCVPGGGLLGVLASRRPAGRLSRTLISAAIVLPFVLGFAIVRLSKPSGDVRLMIAALSMIEIVLFAGLIWVSAFQLDASEEEEEMAKRALAASERLLHQSQKMEAVGVLAGGLAHDFNNLLNVILGYSELLLKDKALPQNHRSKVEKIAKAGQTATALTRQLLAFSRKQVLQPKALDLNEIVSSSDGYLQRFFKENIELTTSLDPGLMATVIDPTQLEQILLNLVVNACDAMPEGGKLQIETANVVIEDPMASDAGVRAGSFIRLTISDTGTGMDEETRLKIFEPFFTTKPIGKGTGLGLATVFGIVKQNGGFIQVDSKLGRGTTFVVYLPGTRIAVSQEAQTASVVEAGESGTILVVEDSEPLREMILETLESMGYTALMAKDGQQAIRLCNQFSGTIDVLLSDVIMPRMNGPEVMRRVKEIRPEIAVLFMSGYTNDVTLRHGVSNAEVSFIQKPFTSIELMHKIREARVETRERTQVRERLNLARAKLENPTAAKDS